MAQRNRPSPTSSRRAATQASRSGSRTPDPAVRRDERGARPSSAADDAAKLGAPPNQGFSGSESIDEDKAGGAGREFPTRAFGTPEQGAQQRGSTAGSRETSRAKSGAAAPPAATPARSPNWRGLDAEPHEGRDAGAGAPPRGGRRAGPKR
jgi:hypothetical protein